MIQYLTWRLRRYFQYLLNVPDKDLIADDLDAITDCLETLEDRQNSDFRLLIDQIGTTDHHKANSLKARYAARLQKGL